ncbi:MAG: response regulator transcription factor [Dinghuibacter sp.]|nr:response regulator transcription factor [Dinghuibacter sp.]
MKLSAILVDDEFHAVENLKRLLKQYCPFFEVLGEAYDTAEAIKLVNNIQPDVVFLDIKMPGGNSLETVCLSLPRKTLVVFVTAYDEFALRAIKFGALDYLMKPVDPEELVAAGKKAQEHFTVAGRQNGDDYTKALQQAYTAIEQSEPPALIGLYTNNEYISLRADEAITFEAIGAYTRIYATNNREFVTSKNIGYYESLLQGVPAFFRVHKSFIINTGRISSVNKTGRTVKMNNDKFIPVSYRTMPQFISFLGR